MLLGNVWMAKLALGPIVLLIAAIEVHKIGYFVSRSTGQDG